MFLNHFYGLLLNIIEIMKSTYLRFFITFKFLDIILLELFLRIVINKIKIPKIFYYTNYKKKLFIVRSVNKKLIII